MITIPDPSNGRCDGPGMCHNCDARIAAGLDPFSNNPLLGGIVSDAQKRYVIVSVHARRELEEMSDKLDSLRRVYESELMSAAESHSIPSDSYCGDLYAAADNLRNIARMERATDV